MKLSKRIELATKVEKLMAMDNVLWTTLNVINALNELCFLDENEYDDKGNLITDGCDLENPTVGVYWRRVAL